MPAHRSTPGPRWTPPEVKAPDIRDGSFHRPEFIERMREFAVSDRLDLSGAEHEPLPPGLRDLRYVCDQDNLTAFAGMPAFMQFCYACGLGDWLGGLPIKRRRDAVYPASKMGEVTVGILAAGLKRVSHVDDVKYDPGLCAALGLQQLPDQATMSRFFSDATENAVQFVQTLNQQFSVATMSQMKPQKRLIVDADTRDMHVYGKQEGTTHITRYGGDRIYTFETITLRNGRDMLHGELLEGATNPAPRFPKHLNRILHQVAGQTDEAIFCADRAWYADYIMRRIENADKSKQVPCRCKYAIRARLRGELPTLIAAIDDSQWERYDKHIEVAEIEFALTKPRDENGKRVYKDNPKRRYVVTRKRLEDRDTDGDQQALIDEPRYEYDAIVTSLGWQRKKVVRLYNARATVENILKETALGFHIDSLPSMGFSGNRLFCQLLVLAYNLVNLFRRLCLPEQAKRQHVTGLRRRLLRVPGRLTDTEDGMVVRCSRTGPHVSWLDHLLQALAGWLAPPGLEPAPATIGGG